LIVCLNAKKDIYKKSLEKALMSEDSLSMKEVPGDITGKKFGQMFFGGSKPIDGIWATSDVEIINACTIPVGYGIYNHCIFILDIVHLSLIGKTPFQIQWLVSRHLNTKSAGGLQQNTLLPSS
jgi:hypothetical protein